MSILDISMLIIAIVFAVIVGFQVVKLVKAIRDKRNKRGQDDRADENVSSKDKKGE